MPFQFVLRSNFKSTASHHEVHMMRLAYCHRSNTLYNPKWPGGELSGLSRGAVEFIKQEAQRWMQKRPVRDGDHVMVALPLSPHMVRWSTRPPQRLAPRNDRIVEVVFQRLGPPDIKLKQPRRSGMTFPLAWDRPAFRHSFELKMMAELHRNRGRVVENAALAGLDFILPPAPPSPPAHIEAPASSEPPSRWESGNHFIQRLLKRGYVTIGAGAYSTVLGKPGSDRVIKVNRLLDNWVDYVVWAAKHGHAGKFAPVVHSYRIITARGGTRFYVAVVERIDKTLTHVEHTRPTIFKAYVQLRYYMDHSREEGGIAADRVLPGSLRFAMDFKRFFKGRYDLHSGNWMVRKDGIIVCTDPLAQDGVSTSTPRKMRSKDFAALSRAH